MTGAEQLSVNEIGRRVDTLTQTVASGFEKLDRRLQTLEDDKVARDAVRDAHKRSIEASRSTLTLLVVGGTALATLALRLLGIS